jgi:hypothetical protein
MMNTYILSYSPLDEKVSAYQLLAFIRDNRKIAQYYQPWMGTYIIKSQEDLVSLLSSFNLLFHGSSYILSRIFTTQMGGMLTPEIWNWINTDTVPAVPPLGGLLSRIAMDKTEP